MIVVRSVALLGCIGFVLVLTPFGIKYHEADGRLGALVMAFWFALCGALIAVQP